ncbi:MAG: acetyl-CoA acetyltransferase, partial [Deltaproteobacteria bacterium HGW-Deltaproteobacteria-17]
MGSGIRDKVAILGMGCTKYGERWNCDAEDLAVAGGLGQRLADVT